MKCEKCGTIYSGSPICPICRQIEGGRIDWEGNDQFDVEATEDAMIIGTLDDVWGDPSVSHGMTSGGDGASLPMRFYATKSPARMLADQAVPSIVRRRSATSAFEQVILDWIDGSKSVAELAQMSPLAADELSATLIALAERGVITFRASDAVTEEANVPRSLLREDEEEEELDETDDFVMLEGEVTEETEPGAPLERYRPRRPPTPPPPSMPPLLSSEHLVAVAPETEMSVSEELPPIAEPPPLMSPRDIRVSDLVLPAAKPPITPMEVKSERRARAGEKPGEKLYQQAQADEQAGNLNAAHSNIKLALVFDRNNRAYAAMLERLTRRLGDVNKSETPRGQAAALFEKATRAEGMNRVDEAVEYLEQAIALSKDDALYLNRLGIILAIRKRELERGRDLMVKAVALAPSNRTYRNNLDKVEKLLHARAAKNAEAKTRDAKSGSLLGGIFNKKK